MRKLITFYLILSLCYNPMTWALQTKAVKDNQTVSVKIAAHFPSRIFAFNDRILKARGVDGTYDLKKDDTLGEIFIQPTLDDKKVLTLFVTTEAGHRYTLLLNPMNTPAETIELKPLSPSIEKASIWEKNSPYVDLLITLMHDMANGLIPEGYTVIEITKVKPKILENGLSMQLITLYQGHHLYGEIWKIKNTGKNPISLCENDFYNDDTRALSFVDESLSRGSETLLYRVVSHEA